jgi:hypothetical protein
VLHRSFVSCAHTWFSPSADPVHLAAMSGPAQVSQNSFFPLEQQQHQQYRQAHALDELAEPPAASSEMGSAGWATEWQDLQWRQTQTEQDLMLLHDELNPEMLQGGNGTQPLPPPELCYAVDFDPNMAVPYIFEPMAVYSNGQPMNFEPSQDGEYAEMSFGPLGGVSASDLTEMWCMLEEEESQKVQQPQGGNSALVPDWTGNADDALSGWAELGGEYDIKAFAVSNFFDSWSIFQQSPTMEKAHRQSNSPLTLPKRSLPTGRPSHRTSISKMQVTVISPRLSLPGKLPATVNLRFCPTSARDI